MGFDGREVDYNLQFLQRTANLYGTRLAQIDLYGQFA